MGLVPARSDRAAAGSAVAVTAAGCCRLTWGRARPRLRRLDRRCGLQTTRPGLGQQVTAWTTALAELRSAANAPDLTDLDPELADETRAAAQRAVVALDRARHAEQEARSARDSQLMSADRLRERLAEVSEAEAGLEALAASTAPVIYLAGLAKGVDGHRRVALTTYVLRHWFEQVVAAANIRLAVMSSGRYELRRSDEGESKRQRVGLTLSVIDRYTGEERSPRSLSGGEAFYTSLALALGLAERRQGRGRGSRSGDAVY